MKKLFSFVLLSIFMSSGLLASSRIKDRINFFEREAERVHKEYLSSYKPAPEALIVRSTKLAPEVPMVRPTKPAPEVPMVRPTKPAPEAPTVRPTKPAPEAPVVRPTKPAPKAPVVRPTKPAPKAPVVRPTKPAPKAPMILRPTKSVPEAPVVRPTKSLASKKVISVSSPFSSINLLEQIKKGIALRQKKGIALRHTKIVPSSRKKSSLEALLLKRRESMGFKDDFEETAPIVLKKPRISSKIPKAPEVLKKVNKEEASSDQVEFRGNPMRMNMLQAIRNGITLNSVDLDDNKAKTQGSGIIFNMDLLKKIEETYEIDFDDGNSDDEWN